MTKAADTDTSTLLSLWQTLKDSFQRFGENDLLLRSAALSYYTIFSLPPFLLILLRTTSLFYDQELTRKTIFGQLSDYFGQDSVTQIKTTIEQLGLLEREGWSLLIGVGGVLFTSTTIFVTIQNAMNKIFRAESQAAEMGWWQLLRGRIVSLALLLAIAFVLVVSLTVNAVLAKFMELIGLYLPGISSVLLYLASLLLPLLVTGLFFALIFKVLPDRYVSWRTARLGAIVTTALFFLGQYGISFYLGFSNTGNMYDAAGSIMVVMAWVFYASLIFYFGAQFTAVYAARDPAHAYRSSEKDTTPSSPKETA